MSKYITIKNASKILGVSKITLRNWDNSGKLKAYRHPFNNYRIYKVEDLEKIIDLIETSPSIVKQKKSDIRKIMVQHIKENNINQ